MTPLKLAQQVVGTNTGYVTKAVFVGDKHSAGTFSGLQGLGVSSGVVLSSGAVANDDGYTSSVIGLAPTDTSTVFGTPGDTSLSELYGAATNDASVLQFTVLPFASQLVIHYVVATHEATGYYNEGPEILVNGQNCAVVGTPPIPATLGNLIGGSAAAYWTSNGGAYPNAFDGFTSMLTCRASVRVGVATTVKIGIADAIDGEVDTDVLLAQGV